jgi:putative redox protein
MSNENATRVEVEETLTSRFIQTVRSGRHTLVADEPVASGGKDAGPGPYDFLLMGLGACTSMTVRMYAEHKKIPLKRVRVFLSHGKIHADDCSDCETKEGKVDEIVRDVVLEGEALTDEQRQRLMEIANRCPVHRTLSSEIKIRSRLVDTRSADPRRAPS